jgi:peptide deformylase
MSLLTILRYPDPRLHKVASPVRQIDERIRKLVADMLETMYAAKGIGLAATQVDAHVRVVVIDVSEERNAPLVLINPEIIAASTETEVGEEGCLSVPDIYDKLPRHVTVRVRTQDLSGKTTEFEADDLLSVCVQHEMDHLMGKVFVDHLSALKRNRIRAKLQKRWRDEEAAA